MPQSRIHVVAAPEAVGAPHPTLALGAVCCAVLLVQIDTAIVNLAARPIGAYFVASFEAMQWVIDAYNLVYATLLLSGGLLADFYGRRRLFVIGALAFTFGSAVCAGAPSIGALVAGRVAAGAGAAMLIPASLAIVRVAWPDPAARARVLGAWAVCNGLAIAVGPTLGGLLAERVGWRSIFLVAIPFGVAACWLARRAFAESADPHGRNLDLAAQFAGGLALFGLCLAAIEARRSGQAAIAALVAAGVALAAFIFIERRQGESALAPLDLFRARTFRGAALGTAGMTFAMYGNLFVLPLAWRDGGVLTIAQAGVALVPMALVYVFVAPYAAGLAGKLGAGVVGAVGGASIAVGVFAIGASGPTGVVALAEIGLALAGLGMGLMTSPLLNAAVGAVESRRSGTASSLINVARLVGATLGVAVMGAIFASQSTPAWGLAVAMACGGAVQLGCAALCWRELRLPGDGRSPAEQNQETPLHRPPATDAPSREEHASSPDGARRRSAPRASPAARRRCGSNG